MAPRVLVVDSNAAFATVLKEMLETEGGYVVRLAPGGRDALAMLERGRFDLTIVDMDLDPAEMGYRELIRRVRRSQPDMRLVLIPLMGQSLSPEDHELHVQGTLSKPFFADDLLPGIKAAMSAPVPALAAADAAVPAAPGRTVPFAGGVARAQPPVTPRGAATVQPESRFREILLDLARETQADLVAIVSLRDGGRVVAQAGQAEDEPAAPLAGHCLALLRAAQGLAGLLGQPDLPFEHNMFESGSYRVYILSLPDDLCLLLAAPLGAPLGAVRHNLRRAGRELAAFRLT